MCGGPDQTHAPHMARVSPLKGSPTTNIKKDFEMGGSCLLEWAAEDDLDRFQKCVEEGNVKVDDAGMWYVRSNGGRKMVLEQRTPFMIASLYGSINVLAYIMGRYAMEGGNLDQACGSDGSSALHYAAAGGSMRAFEAVKILLDAGADVNVRDIQGRRPVDVLVLPHGCADAKLMLQLLLGKDKCYAEHNTNTCDELKKCFASSAFEDVGIRIDVSSVRSSSSSLALSTASGASSVSLSPSASSSPKSPIALSTRGYVDDVEKARECSVDQSLPDIKNTFYTSDEFRMYSFKIRPCSRAYSHDWTECPFAHPGENARRRDPRRYHYSCVPCPDFRKGACSQGDMCEYAHGVFECWLHPAQYRTRLCKDGVECNRKVCFFAHKAEELRPVYAATGSGLPSPILSAFTELSCMSPPLAPCSPSMMPPFSPLPIQSTLQGSLRTPPMSPSSSSLANAQWQQPNIPTLHLPGASLQASRLRAALHARDVSTGDDFDEQILSDFQSPSAHSLSMQARLNAAVAASGTVGASSSRSGRYKSLGLSLAPANLEELFASETVSSPGMGMCESPPSAQFERENTPMGSIALPQGRLLMAHLQSSAVRSPRDTSCNLESRKVLHGVGQGGRAEGQGMCKGSTSPSLFGALGNKSTWDVGAGGCTWSDWGSPTGKPEWGIQGEDLSKMRRSVSVHTQGPAEPWRQEAAKEGRPLQEDAGGVPSKCLNNGNGPLQKEGGAVEMLMLGSWIDTLCLDEIVA